MSIKFRHMVLPTVALLIGLLAMVAGCAREVTNPTLAVSIAPQKWLLDKIVGDKYEVVTLLTPEANPETYDPSTGSLMALQRSKIYFRTGTIGFEQASLPKIAENFPDLRIANSGKGISFVEGTHNGPAGFDPHIWTSVRNARVMAKNMYEEVVKLDPANKAYYDRRYRNLDNELVDLDNELASRLASKKGSSFVIQHPSLSYFAKDYGLVQITLEQGGKEPTPKQMQQRLREAEKADATVFFVEKSHDSPAIRNIAEQLNLPVHEVTLLDYDWDKNLMKVADAIAGN